MILARIPRITSTHLIAGLALLAALFIGLITPALAAGTAQVSSTPIAVTPDWIAAAAGMLFSLAFAYLPGVKQAYGSLTDEWKAATMGIVLILIAIASFAVGCAGLFPELQVTCDRPGAVGVFTALVAALMANQGTFMLAVKPFRTAGDPLAALDVGDTVHFVLDEGPRKGQHRGAFVVYVWNRDPGTVNLQVINDSNGPGSNDGRPALEWKTSVLYDPSGTKPNSWHFPERGA